jgi:predicted  nucleic acid-binding Zn-ribbon protein
MWVLIIGKSADNNADPLYVGNGEREKISKSCPTTMLQETVERWLRMGRQIDSIRLIIDSDQDSTVDPPTVELDRNDVPSDDQIESMRFLRQGGVYEVNIERTRPNGDIIVSQRRPNSRRERLSLIERDGKIIGDNSPVGW